jgi:DNA polymerase III alpha subunit
MTWYQEYCDYIASPEWQVKRDARRVLDGNRCRGCDSDEQLNVHHRPLSYNKIPNESIEDDLITLCRRCHEALHRIIDERQGDTRESAMTKRLEYARVVLRKIATDLSRIVTHTLVDIVEDQAGRGVVVAGIIINVHQIITKRGETMAFILLEDLRGTLSVTAFPEVYTVEKDKLIPGEIVIVVGKVSVYNERVGIVVESIIASRGVDAT